jgi:uncharacterized membrane protein YccC
LIDVLDLWREAVWLRSHVVSETHLPKIQPAPAFRPYRDPIAALIGGAVTAIAVMAACAFWIFTAWPSGTGAVTYTAIICAIKGGSDNPGAASAIFLRMGVVGSVIAAIYVFVILPLVTDFASLVVALAPFYLICGALVARPSALPSVMPVIFVGGGLMSIQNVMVYDFVSFLNRALANVVGIGIGGASLRLLRPAGVAWATHRLVRGLFLDLAGICQGRKTDRAAFESRTFDRINALFLRLDPSIDEERMLIQGGLASLRIGLNVRVLRQLLPELPTAAASSVADALTALASHFAQSAKGRKASPLGVLEFARQRILASDTSASTLRTAEALFSIAMTMQQHEASFGWSGDESASNNMKVGLA